MVKTLEDIIELRNERQEVKAMLQEVKENCGLLYKSIDRELGVDYPLTSKVSSLGQRSTYYPSIKKIIQNRGKILSNCRLRNTDDLENILHTAGISHAFMAKKLDISPQSFRDRLIRGFTPEMLEEAEGVLRDIGMRLRRTFN